MSIKQKRQAGEILGRDGISQRIILIAKQISQGTYKDAIELGGRIAELAAAASYDVYWTEKADIGRGKEQQVFSCLILDPAKKDKVTNTLCAVLK